MMSCTSIEKPKQQRRDTRPGLMTILSAKLLRARRLVLEFSSVTKTPKCEWNEAVNFIFDREEVSAVQNGIQE